MQKLLAKKLNKKGFTLAELLIVVAIIAVLVAIAIPIFTGSLNKARLGVHRSNARNLKSMAVAAILADKEFETHTSTSAWKVIGSYNFSSQQFVISEIKPQTEAGVSMGVYKTQGGTAPTDTPILFGDANSEHEIGTIGTSNLTWYVVTVVANDFSTSVDWGTAGG